MTTLRYRPTLSRLGLEMIDFQKDGFGKTLENFFKQIEADIKNNEYRSRKELSESGYPVELEELIFKRFGLKLRVVMDTECAGAIMPYYANNQHILAQHWIRDWLDDEASFNRIRKDITNKTGTIDLKKAKLAGIFSVYVHDCWLDVYGNLTNYKLSPGQIAAILLHEIGHAFTYYEYSDRMSRTNQVMLDLSEHLFSNKEKDLNYVYAEVKKLKEFTKEEAEVLTGDNRVIAGIRLSRIYVECVGTALMNDKYNDTSSEQLADMFASRFGMGRELIEGLETLYKYHGGAPEHSSGAGRFFMYITTFLGDLFLPGAFFFWLLPASLPLALATGVMLAIFIMYISGDAKRDMTYDDLKQRYIRIRQQYISLIKDKNLDIPTLKTHVDKLDYVDSVIAGLKPFSRIFQTISNIVFSNNKEAKSDIELQQLVENLAHNDLFLMSAKFRVSNQGN